MSDTVRTRSELVTALADNTSGAITAQVMRDWLISSYLKVESVPYSGATSGLDLGSYSITASNFGSGASVGRNAHVYSGANVGSGSTIYNNASVSGTNTGDQDLSNFVPYSGASSDVNIGSYSYLTDNSINITGKADIGERTLVVVVDDPISYTASDPDSGAIASGSTIYFRIWSYLDSGTSGLTTKLYSSDPTTLTYTSSGFEGGSSYVQLNGFDSGSPCDGYVIENRVDYGGSIATWKDIGLNNASGRTSVHAPYITSGWNIAQYSVSGTEYPYEVVSNDPTGSAASFDFTGPFMTGDYAQVKIRGFKPGSTWGVSGGGDIISSGIDLTDTALSDGVALNMSWTNQEVESIVEVSITFAIDSSVSGYWIHLSGDSSISINGELPPGGWNVGTFPSGDYILTPYSVDVPAPSGDIGGFLSGAGCFSPGSVNVDIYTFATALNGTNVYKKANFIGTITEPFSNMVLSGVGVLSDGYLPNGSIIAVSGSMMDNDGLPSGMEFYHEVGTWLEEPLSDYTIIGFDPNATQGEFVASPTSPYFIPESGIFLYSDKINMSNLPTSDAGLQVGDLWNSGGSVAIMSV